MLKYVKSTDKAKEFIGTFSFKLNSSEFLDSVNIINCIITSDARTLDLYFVENNLKVVYQSLTGVSSLFVPILPSGKYQEIFYKISFDYLIRALRLFKGSDLLTIMIKPDKNFPILMLSSEFDKFSHKIFLPFVAA